jgi:hypothetical protein
MLQETSSSNQDDSVIALTKDIIYRNGKPVKVDGIRIDNKRLIVKGRFLTVVQLWDEWYEDVGDPELIIRSLKRYTPTPDIFTFWQRLPDSVPLYPYYHESEALSAIPLKDFRHWWERQIKSDTRKKAKRAEKRGVEIKVISPDDELINGVMGIFNETPVRRGKPFWHYGKQFAEVKAMLSADFARSKYIGAYDKGSLVGFVKLVFAEERFANPGLIISTLEARKKYVNNALIAKAVELCSDAGIPYLTYTGWRKGTQAEFLIRNGFQKTLVPRYWIPITKKGAVAIKLGLHRKVGAYIPEPVMVLLLDLRRSFYSWRYRNNGHEGDYQLG